MERNTKETRTLLVESAEQIAGGIVSPAYAGQDRLEMVMHLASVAANLMADTTLSARHILAITHLIDLAYAMGRVDGRKGEE